jgi:hypothetical protein
MTAQGARTTSGHEDVRLVDQAMQGLAAVLCVGVHSGACFADHSIDRLPWQFRSMRSIDSQHVGTECAKHARSDRSGDHPGQVEDFHA